MVYPESPFFRFSGTAARTAAVLVILLPLLLLSTGCATYSAKLKNLKPQLANGEFDKALATVEDESGSKDRLLYYLERGLILHYADRFAESNEAFAAAERTADELYTKSISEGAFSLFSNDNAISYRARPFEMAMVPYYKGLNYIYLGQRNEAQVEARRASLQLSKYVDATLDGLRDEDKGDFEKVRNNAFLLYYSGMLYDWDGELNDAFIAYRNAAVAYQQNHGLLEVDIPPSLGPDLTRVAGRIGFRGELDHLHKTCPDVFAFGADEDSLPRTREDYEKAAAWRRGNGEVVLLLESGFVAQKSQVRFDIPIFEGEAYNDPDYWSWQIWAGMGNMQALVAGRKVEYWATVAAPQLDDQLPGPVGGARVTAGLAGDHTVTTRIENCTRQARITFDAEKPSIFFKTILRGLTKYLATRGAEEAGGSWAGLAANIFGAVTESADTRSWMTLPEHVNLARLSLPPGIYDLQVELLGRDGEILSTQIVPGVEVWAGDWTFISRRVF
ncbi:MAG: hypothetical protein ABFS42_08520 [Candidatus Krumholzibacteriota bacterium]